MEISTEQLTAFRTKVLERGRELYRDLPWRRTRDPYAVWLSEVMLQQTQVRRVEVYWQRWMGLFPTVDALASADSADVLEAWQGLGYNRRALAALDCARQISEAKGSFPVEEADLCSLPGIGPATAAGIRAFAYDLPGVYLETNVRTVFLHEFFPDTDDVPDQELRELVWLSCPKDASDPADTPRIWYWALLDYGAWLKRNFPNPSRRSRSYKLQSPFVGSHRQKRAELLRLLLAWDSATCGPATGEALAQSCLFPGECEDILAELSREGFCHKENGLWRIS